MKISPVVTLSANSKPSGTVRFGRWHRDASVIFETRAPEMMATIVAVCAERKWAGVGNAPKSNEYQRIDIVINGIAHDKFVKAITPDLDKIQTDLNTRDALNAPLIELLRNIAEEGKMTMELLQYVYAKVQNRRRFYGSKGLAETMVKYWQELKGPVATRG